MDSVRSVTLLFEAGRLLLDVTAELPVDTVPPDAVKVAGVDIGVIHPFAVAADGGSLLISGRALRSEERLHLEDTRARQRKMAPKVPKKGQRGSRRYRRPRATQRRAEARHKRKTRQAHHESAKQVVEFAKENKIGTVEENPLSSLSPGQSRDSRRQGGVRLGEGELFYMPILQSEGLQTQRKGV